MKIIKYKKKVYYNRFLVKLIKIVIPFILLFLKTNLIGIRGRIPNVRPLLIAAHHEELADHFIISLSTKRRLFWVADTTPFGGCLADSFFVKWLLMRLGAIPIDKKNPKRNVNLFDYLFYLLRRGEAIVIFPEAYIRSERHGKKFGTFKDGVIRTALEYKKKFNKKIPICPVGLRYIKENKINKAELNIGSTIIVKNIKEKSKLFNEIKRLS